MDMASNADKPIATNIVECASCRSLGRSEKAVKYCLNCMECMCQQCLNICHTPKPMRQHEFIDIGNICDKSTDDLDLLQKISTLVACPSHPNDTIKFHCLDHDSFCCTICVVADHRKCSEVVEIEKQVDGKEFKAELALTKHSVLNVRLFASKTIEQLHSTVKAQHKQVKHIAEYIDEIRTKIVKVLDELEQTSKESAEAMTSREILKIKEEIKRLETEAETFEVHATLMEKSDKTGSVSHQYIARIKCQETVRKFEAFLEKKTKLFESINVSFKGTNLLDELLKLDPNDAAKLGSVIESQDKPLNSIYNANTKLKSCSFYKIGGKVMKRKYSFRSSVYTSAVFLPNHQLVLLDSGHCLLASEDGNVLSSCDVVSSGATSNSKPYCTVTKPEGLIAVSLPEQKKICFISTSDGQLKVTDKVIQTKYTPGAIFGLKNGDIAVTWKDPVAFGIIDINTKGADKEDKVYFCQDKEGRSLKSFEYMAINEKRSHVIQPCTTDEAVYCFDFSGNPKFKYTNPELENPRGVAVDRDGNIYVCDWSAHCIHVISPTGSASRLIKDGCPERPLAIAFNKDGDRFAVTCTSGLNNVPLITFFRVHIENS